MTEEEKFLTVNSLKPGPVILKWPRTCRKVSSNLPNDRCPRHGAHVTAVGMD